MKLPAELVHRIRPAIAGKRVCVTGGAGFIGGHLVDALLSLEASVSVIDDLSNATAQRLIEHIELEPAHIKFIHGSILDEDALAEALAGCEIVFHQAAVGSVPLSIENPSRSWAVNATGTVRVLEAARKVAAGGNNASVRVIYAASSSAYGDSAQTLAKSEALVPAPISPYAASKLAGEHALGAWAKAYGLGAVGLRYFNVFGPRQAADSPYSAVIASFCKKIISLESPLIFGDGTQSRDFTPVASVVAANLLAATTSKELHGQVVNIGTGRAADLLTILKLLNRANIADGGKDMLEPTFRPSRSGDVRFSLADISAARALLDYHPIGTLEDALGETLSWYRASMQQA